MSGQSQTFVFFSLQFIPASSLKADVAVISLKKTMTWFRRASSDTSTCCFLWATRDSLNKINRLMLLLQRRMMRAQRLNIGTGLWHYVRKWWATEYFSCSSTDPRHNYEQMAEDLSYSFSVVLPLFRLLFPDFFISLFENFSERGKLLHADILFCFC